MEQERRRELRNDLALALYNLAETLEKQGAQTALDTAREARILRQEMVNEGIKHLEKDLAKAKALEARLS